MKEALSLESIRGRKEHLDKVTEHVKVHPAEYIDYVIAQSDYRQCLDSMYFHLFGQ